MRLSDGISFKLCRECFVKPCVRIFLQSCGKPYVALCTADPTDAGTGASMNEVANSNNYAREAITFAAASSRRVTQSGNIEMNEASGSWGTITTRLS